jgi:NAD(P)-dependent dehydrogenase (short-subunit alcohol dehydrogenase family)
MGASVGPRALLEEGASVSWGASVGEGAVIGAGAVVAAGSEVTGSKMAIEGFTASLAFELQAFNVQVKLVEPGYCPATRFTANGGSRMEGLIPEAYADFAQPIFAAFARPALVTSESDVAEAVWRAANDATGTLRFPAGPDAVALARSA